MFTDSGIFSKRQYFFKMTKHNPDLFFSAVVSGLRTLVVEKIPDVKKKVWATGQWQLKFFLVPFKLG